MSNDAAPKSDRTDNNLKTLCHAIPLPFVKICCIAYDGLHVVMSNLFLCLIKQRELKAHKLIQLNVHIIRHNTTRI